MKLTKLLAEIKIIPKRIETLVNSASLEDDLAFITCELDRFKIGGTLFLDSQQVALHILHDVIPPSVDWLNENEIPYEVDEYMEEYVNYFIPIEYFNIDDPEGHLKEQ